MTAPQARVLRDGHPIVVPAAEVVLGDVLLLEPGDIIAADARLTEAHRLSANEATLTGESVPSDKTASEGHQRPLVALHLGPVDPAAPLADRDDRTASDRHDCAPAG